MDDFAVSSSSLNRLPFLHCFPHSLIHFLGRIWSNLLNMATHILAGHRLSLAGKLDMLTALASILSAGFFALFTGIVRGQKGAPTFFLHVAYSILRKATARLSVLQLQ
jgi:hypothetical protein